MTRFKRGRFLALLVLALAVFMIGCSGSGGNEGPGGTPNDNEQTGQADPGTGSNEPKPTTKVRAVFPIGAPDISFAYHYVALDKGYFAEEGIDPEFLYASGTGAAGTQVLGGAAEFGQVSPEVVINAWQENERLVGTWSLLKPIFGVWALTEHGINEPADLKGKTIGIIGMSSGTRYATQEILASAGLTEEDVELVVLGALGAYAPAIAEGKVDAVGIWDVGRWITEQQLAPELVDSMLWIPAENHLSDHWVVDGDFYDENFDVVVGFFTAMRKGQIYMEKYPVEAAKIAAKHMPESRDPTEQDYAVIGLRVERIIPDGRFDHADMRTKLSLYAEMDLIRVDDVAELPLEEMFSNAVSDEVEKRVAGWTPEQ